MSEKKPLAISYMIFTVLPVLPNGETDTEKGSTTREVLDALFEKYGITPETRNVSATLNKMHTLKNGVVHKVPGERVRFYSTTPTFWTNPRRSKKLQATIAQTAAEPCKPSAASVLREVLGPGWGFAR